MRRAWFVVVIAIAGCGGEPPVETETRPIIDGSSAAGRDLAVALLISRKPGWRQLCSASMITPRVVLTAAHCIEGYDTHEVWFADAYDSNTGELDAPLDEVEREAIAKWIHPDWDPELILNDIALLYLDTPAPEAAAPIPWNRYRLRQDVVGTELRMIGFGHRVAESPSSRFLKLYATNDVSLLGPHTVEVWDMTHITCQGDSGGPALLVVDGEERVSGITSFGDQGCDEFASFARVDVHLDDIRAFIAQHDPQPPGACVADGTCDAWCDAPDPDCPCAGEGVCSEACDDPARDPDCPAACGGGDACQRDGCPIPDPDCGDAPLGAACAGDGACLSGNCHDALGVCVEPCGAGGTCPASFACGAGNLCEPVADAGCGCRAAPGSAGWWGSALLVALFSASRWRRGRRSRPPGSGAAPR